MPANRICHRPSALASQKLSELLRLLHELSIETRQFRVHQSRGRRDATVRILDFLQDTKKPRFRRPQPTGSMSGQAAPPSRRTRSGAFYAELALKAISAGNHTVTALL